MICGNCGANVPDNAKFCQKCGRPIVNSVSYNSGYSSPQQIYTLTIIRPDQLFLVNPTIKVTIDNSNVREIENDSAISVSLYPGTHTVHFSCGVHSKTMHVDMYRDTTISVKWDRFTGGIESAPIY